MKRLALFLCLAFSSVCFAQTTPSNTTCGNPPVPYYLYNNHFYMCANGTPTQVDGGNFTLTTTGSSGASTLLNGTLNIPVYSSGGGGSTGSCTTNSTGNKCLGVSPYVAVAGDYSVAVNAAITDLVTDGGGTLWVPDGTYPLNGALQDTGAAFTATTTSGSPTITVSSATGLAAGNPIFGTGIRAGTLITTVVGTTITLSAPATASGSGVSMHAGGANAIVTLPRIALGASPEIPIRISGFTPTANVGSTGGAQFTTTMSTGALFGGYDVSGLYGGLITTDFLLNHLTITNSTANNCAIMVDAQSMSNADIQDVILNSSAGSTCSENAGLITPRVASNVRSEINKVVATNFYIGVQLGEHAHVGSLLESANVYGLLVDDALGVLGETAGAEGNSVDYFWCQLCTHQLAAATSQGVINVQHMDAEVSITDVINDPNSKLYGAINFQVPYADGRSASTPLAPVITGANNVYWCNDLAANSTVAHCSITTAQLISAILPGTGSAFSGSYLQPNLNSGANFTGVTLGVANATNNAAVFLFNYAGGSGSANNFMTFGTYGGTDWERYFPDGSATSGVTTAPSGACAHNGSWVFSQDGHATYCNSGTWQSKI